MTLIEQIPLGTSALLICTLLHVAILTTTVPVLACLGHRTKHMHQPLRNITLLGCGGGAIVAGHTLQAWIWAAAFFLMSVFSTFEENFYYAVVTYTTLGHGDLVAPLGVSVFATFASITGLLSFGISTAFLISMLTRIFPAFNE